MRYTVILIMLSCLLTGCSKPLPDDRLLYAGDWQGENMTLTIWQDGKIDYKRVNGASTVTINGPIKEFVGNDFVVGFWFVTSTFNVAEPPKQVEGQWQMVVDGVRLVKE